MSHKNSKGARGASSSNGGRRNRKGANNAVRGNGQNARKNGQNTARSARKKQNGGTPRNTAPDKLTGQTRAETEAKGTTAGGNGAAAAATPPQDENPIAAGEQDTAREGGIALPAPEKTAAEDAEKPTDTPDTPTQQAETDAESQKAPQKSEEQTTPDASHEPEETSGNSGTAQDGPAAEEPAEEPAAEPAAKEEPAQDEQPALADDEEKPEEAPVETGQPASQADAAEEFHGDETTVIAPLRIAADDGVSDGDELPGETTVLLAPLRLEGEPAEDEPPADDELPGEATTVLEPLKIAAADEGFANPPAETGRPEQTEQPEQPDGKDEPDETPTGETPAVERLDGEPESDETPTGEAPAGEDLGREDADTRPAAPEPSPDAEPGPEGRPTEEGEPAEAHEPPEPASEAEPQTEHTDEPATPQIPDVSVVTGAAAEAAEDEAHDARKEKGKKKDKRKDEETGEPEKAAKQRKPIRRSTLMRAIVAPIFTLVAVVMLVFGILNATTWKPIENVRVTTPQVSTRYLTTTAGVLQIIDDEVSISVQSTDPQADLCAEVARQADVSGWLSGIPYTRVTDMSSWHDLSVQSAQSGDVDDNTNMEAISFKGSDLWNQATCGTGSVNIPMQSYDPRDVLIVASDASEVSLLSDASAPYTLTLGWHREDVPNYAMPFFVVAALFFILAILSATVFARESKRARRRKDAEEVPLWEQTMVMARAHRHARGTHSKDGAGAAQENAAGAPAAGAVKAVDIADGTGVNITDETTGEITASYSIDDFRAYFDRLKNESQGFKAETLITDTNPGAGSGEAGEAAADGKTLETTWPAVGESPYAPPADVAPEAVPEEADGAAGDTAGIDAGAEEASDSVSDDDSSDNAKDEGGAENDAAAVTEPAAHADEIAEKPADEQSDAPSGGIQAEKEAAGNPADASEEPDGDKDDDDKEGTR